MALEVSSSAGWWQAPQASRMVPCSPGCLSWASCACSTIRQGGEHQWHASGQAAHAPALPLVSLPGWAVPGLRAVLFPMGKTVRGLCCVCASSQSSLVVWLLRKTPALVTRDSAVTIPPIMSPACRTCFQMFLTAMILKHIHTSWGWASQHCRGLSPLTSEA